MNQPRKHHYLPQFYLRGFSPDGQSIFQVNKDDARGYSCAVNDAAAIRDFHKLDDSTAEDPQKFEKSLSDWEQRLSVPLARIRKSHQITEDDLPGLIHFLSQMRFRVPSFKTLVEHINREMVQSGLRILERSGNLPPVPPGLEQTLSVDNIVVDIRNWKLLQEMFNLASDEDHLRILASMNIRLCEAPDGAEFVTCDQPFVMYDPTVSPNDQLGTALVDPAVEVTFPLSGKLMLHLSWHKADAGNCLLSQRQVDEFNRRTVIMANSYVFATRHSGAAIDLVSRYGCYSAGWDIRLYNTGKSDVLWSRLRAVMAPDRYESAVESK